MSSVVQAPDDAVSDKAGPDGNDTSDDTSSVLSDGSASRVKENIDLDVVDRKVQRRRWVKLGMCAVVLLSVVMIAVNIAILSPSRNRLNNIRKSVSVPYTLVPFSIYSAIEREWSIPYVQMVILNGTLRGTSTMMKGFQNSSLTWLKESLSTMQAYAGHTSNAYQMLSRSFVDFEYSEMLGTQVRVLARNIAPVHLYFTFYEYVCNISSNIEFFTSHAVSLDVSGTFGAYAVAKISLINALELAVLRDAVAQGTSNLELITQASQISVLKTRVHTELYMLYGKVELKEWFDPMIQALHIGDEQLEQVLSTMEKTGDWDDLVIKQNSEYTPLGFLYYNVHLAALKSFDNIVIRAQNAQFDYHGVYVILVVNCVALSFAVLLGVLIGVNTIISIATADNVRMEMRLIYDVQNSVQRMENFVDALCGLDMQTADHITTAQYGTAPSPVEWSVFALRNPITHLLSFIHPCILSRRDASCEALVSTGLVQSPTVTLLFVDLERLHVRITNESAKTSPKVYNAVTNHVCQILGDLGGVVVDISGTRLIGGWNLNGENDNRENTACRALNTLYDQLVVRMNLNLRFAVVSNVAYLGALGDESLRYFSLLGDLIPMGNLLLKLNYLHGTRAVIDSATFSYVDGQLFSRRPLENIAVDLQSPTTLAFELRPIDRSANAQQSAAAYVSWNEAFDEYQSGNYELALELFHNWKDTYGSTLSVRRLLQLVTESPPRQCTYLNSTDGYIEMELLM